MELLKRVVLFVFTTAGHFGEQLFIHFIIVDGAE